MEKNNRIPPEEVLEAIEDRSKLIELLKPKPTGDIPLQKFVECSFKDTKPYQVRKIYDALIKIKNAKDKETQITLLIPKIQYSVSRRVFRPDAAEFLVKGISKVIERGFDEERFNNFLVLFESIVAFMKSS